MTQQYEPVLLDRAPRFSLRRQQPAAPRSPTPGEPRAWAVSGAWWPHTTDLTAEAAGLEALLGDRASSVDCVMYDPDTWQPAPEQLTLGGHSVRSDGFRHIPAHTLCVLDLERTRLVLLVIPPSTETTTAEALLSAASRPDNELTAGELMTAVNRRGRDGTQQDAALSRWDNEGGRSSPRAPGSPPLTQ